MSADVVGLCECELSGHNLSELISFLDNGSSDQCVGAN
jgi:hypothetical protein